MQKCKKNAKKMQKKCKKNAKMQKCKNKTKVQGNKKARTSIYKK